MTLRTTINRCNGRVHLNETGSIFWTVPVFPYVVRYHPAIIRLENVDPSNTMSRDGLSWSMAVSGECRQMQRFGG
jgi:hypothetical protein